MPCRLALLQLSAASGRPSGTAFICLRRVRDAGALLGVYQHKPKPGEGGQTGCRRITSPSPSPTPPSLAPSALQTTCA